MIVSSFNSHSVLVTEPLLKKRQEKTYRVVEMKRNKLNNSFKAYLEVLNLWDKQDIQTNLRYNIFVLNNDRQMVLGTTTKDIFELEDNPQKFLENLKEIYENAEHSEKTNIQNPEIIVCRNKLGKTINIEPDVIELAQNIADIAPKFGFKLNDFLVINPNSYMSYRDNKLI